MKKTLGVIAGVTAFLLLEGGGDSWSMWAVVAGCFGMFFWGVVLPQMRGDDEVQAPRGPNFFYAPDPTRRGGRVRIRFR